MQDKKKIPEEEKTENKPKEEQPNTPKPDEKPPEEKPTEAPESDENSEGKTIPDEPEKPPEGNSEGNSEGTAEDTAAPEAAPPELSEEDKLREENFRLKTQLEAMKIGFVPDVIEDAVVLAENIVKRDGSDISAALQAVAKKYPDWKADSKGGKSKGGFRVGADSSEQSKADDERIDKAFGLRKRG